MNWMDEIKSFFLDTTTGSWVRIFLIALLFTTLTKFILSFLSVRLRRVTERTRLTWDDIGVDLVDGLRAFVLFSWSFYFLSKSVNDSSGVQKALLTLVVACTVYQMGIWGLYIISRWKDQTFRRRIEKDPSAASALGLMYTTLQALFLIILVLIGLSNLGVDIGALIAGLGVGGIAVALAAQNVLGDLLASLSIVLDKPFVVGDFIITGTEMGTIEQIGIKTTRVRSLSGEELVFSNKDLLESRIRNYKRMWERRVVQTFNVSYNTSAEKLEAIPQWIRGFVEKQNQLRLERCHLSKFNLSSIEFELAFWVKNPDFNIYMDLQQQVLLETFRKFHSEGVRFASDRNFTINDENAQLPRGEMEHDGSLLTQNPKTRELQPRMTGNNEKGPHP